MTRRSAAPDRSPGHVARRLAAAGLAAAACLAATGASAAIARDTLQRLKAATVFVRAGEHRGAGSGSGFLVHRDGERGLVVTNAHVVEGAGGSGLSVVFDSGTRRADALSAELVGKSAARDLAVLSVRSPSLPEPLAIAPGAAVYETQTVHIVGFPFGKGFATNRETPVVTISRGTVSSQRLDVNDQPRLVQIDGDLNPGNSGGPIVDEQGRVVGVAVATVKETNIGFAIPLAALAELLAGSLTDLEGERIGDGLAVRGRLLDPLERFRGATLSLAVMHEDAVLDLLGADGRWSSIAPRAKGVAFARRDADVYEAVHPLPPAPAAGRSLVAQVSVAGAGGARHLAPFRVEPRDLAVTLAGPDVRPGRDADAEAAPGAPSAPGAPAELEALFAASGLDGLIASMSRPAADAVFREEAPEPDEEERTVRERLEAIIDARWDEARIRRVYVRSFEAEPNADALGRALRVFELPAMSLLHLTPDRFSAIGRDDVEAMRDAARKDPESFEKRLDLMREIDERRGFSDLIGENMATSVSTIARLLNDLKPLSTRMAPEILQRDIDHAVRVMHRQVRAAMPLILAHEYRDAREQDLRDYLAQLDSGALRWFAGRERAAYAGVITAQFTEAEDEILALFKEVRREALGLSEAPDLAGLSASQAMQALLDAHGKSTLIRFVLARRGGEINVARGGGFESRFGRPPQDRVTAASLLEDARAMDMDVAAFAAALERYRVNRAYRERRLVANAERARLIAALRERAKAELRASDDPRAKALLDRAARAQAAGCLQECSVAKSSCDQRVSDLHGFCMKAAEGDQEARRRCARKRTSESEACRADRQRCRQECR